MTDAPEPEELPLSEALPRWTDPHLVAAVRAEERRFPPFNLHEYYRFGKSQVQLSADDELRPARASNAWTGPPDIGGLLSAWRILERDLRLRIERGEFHLRGVLVAPIRERTPSIIESAWAADFKFDFHAGRIKVGDAEYVGVIAVRGPAPKQVDAGIAASSSNVHDRAIPEITPETARELSDEEVLLLLEDHARRVVEKGDYKALDPGITKVTFMPLLLRKMRARADAGELLASMKAEAFELEKWIQEKAPSHQTPTAGAIENALRNEYRRLKA